MTAPPAPASEPALLEVRDLRVHFPITRGTVFRRTVGNVHAVDGLARGRGGCRHAVSCATSSSSGGGAGRNPGRLGLPVSTSSAATGL